MHRSSTLALCLAAALATTCVPAARLTTATERGDGPDRSREHSPAPPIPEREGDDRTRGRGPRAGRLDDAGDPGRARRGALARGLRRRRPAARRDPPLLGRGPVVGARSLLPSLYAALDARGAAVGAPGYGVIAASGPNFVSLPGYTEIFGGRPPDGCQDNECAGASGPTIVDAVRDRSGSDSDVAVIASWAPIARAATRMPSRIVLSAGRQDVAGAHFLVDDPSTREVLDEGARADPRPGHDAFRPDRYTAELALRYLEARRPAFLFVGLGEPDEYAHADDYRGYLASLRAADDFFGRLFAVLDRMGEPGPAVAGARHRRSRARPRLPRSRRRAAGVRARVATGPWRTRACPRLRAGSRWRGAWPTWLPPFGRSWAFLSTTSRGRERRCSRSSAKLSRQLAPTGATSQK